MPWNEVMSKFKAGTLKSGGGGKVHSREQAIAIMMSEKRAASHGKSEYKASYDNGGIVPKTGTIHVKKGELVVPADHPAFAQILNLFESADKESPKEDKGEPTEGAQPAGPMAGMMTRPAPPSSIAGGGM